MARRAVLTTRQREALFALPTDEATFLRHYVLSEDDLAHVRRRRRDRNRLGFALQLCASRYPGRLLRPGELIPEPMLAFVGGQLGLGPDVLVDYATRSETRYEHSAALQRLYGYRPFEGVVRERLADWLVDAAETARSNEALTTTMLEELRRRCVIVPGPTTVERACADALVAAERRIAQRIADRLDRATRVRLGRMLSEALPDGTSRFVWLRRHEAGGNSADANRLLDRLEWLTALAIPDDAIAGVPPHRVARLCRQGERYYADGLRELPEARRLAILAVCAIEWRAVIADAMVETHERIAGRLYRSAERACAELVADRKGVIASTLHSFAALSGALVEAHAAGGDVGSAVARSVGWNELERLAATAASLTGAIDADPIDHLGPGYARFRRYAPRMLETLELRGGRPAEPLLTAIRVLRELNCAGRTALPTDPPLGFARPKWRRRLVPSRPHASSGAGVDRRIWETAVLFALRDALRSGDVWLAHSRRHREPGRELVPATAVASAARLAVPLNAADWIKSRRLALDRAIGTVGDACTRGLLAGAIEDGRLRADRLETDAPPGADNLVLDLYRRMPSVRITGLLLDVDREIGFTDAFIDLRTGSACRDKIGLLSVVLADGINLGLKKMAEAVGTRTHWQLLRIARWHVEDDAYERALGMIVEAQAELPIARVWGEGLTSSSDGQFFPAGGPGEALNVVNARYGNEPGVKAYAHLSDQFAPFAVRTIPATAHEAPFILDGLLGCEAGRKVREHYADTGGFTDHVFAACSLLGYSFAPRIRDLPDKRLCAFEPNEAHPSVRPLIAARVRTDLIERNWPDVLRLAASMALGAVQPSAILRKLASYPRQNELALALREVGRVERSLFLLRWIADADLQRRAQLGINKGEAHHALKRAIAFNRRGEIRDRSTEGQHHRVAGLNLIAAAVIHWNTRQLARIVAERTAAGHAPDPALLTHVSPLGWEHINLTGEYRWPTLA
jgi:TnpA family transposase